MFPARLFIFSQSRARKACPFWKIDLVLHLHFQSYLLMFSKGYERGDFRQCLILTLGRDLTKES
ncbi:MAG TPA: hypothetical protein DDW96_01905 [Synergistaceae bacterium]|nr:hypothetical protein [Synergistaceae bacterium]